MSDEADAFAKPTGSHIILPNEKNFYFHNEESPPKADIVVPGGQFAIEGIDTSGDAEVDKLRAQANAIRKQNPYAAAKLDQKANEREKANNAAYLPNTKARIAKRNPIGYGGPSATAVAVVGGMLLIVGWAAGRKK